MKNIIFIMSLLLASISVTFAQDAPKKEVQQSTFICPMHPKEVSLTKKMCQKCDMEMVEVSIKKHNPSVKGSQNSKSKKTIFVCKMDGTTSETAGECPKCGMKMKKTKIKK